MKKIFSSRLVLTAVVFCTLLACEPEVKIEKEYVIVGKINRVVILGNSITITQPVPAIGWHGHWGMAASEQSKDYVHLLIDKFKTYNDHIEVKYGSVSAFERDFISFDLEQLSEYRDFSPDLIIIRLGENVDDSIAKREQFGNYLSKLIAYISNGRTVAVCTTGTFWSLGAVNEELKNLADRERHIYVPLTDLSKDRLNSARGLFADEEVGAHPSDRGMQHIANRIADRLGLFKP